MVGGISPLGRVDINCSYWDTSARCGKKESSLTSRYGSFVFSGVVSSGVKGGSAPSPTQHEVLQNFFKSLLNPKDRAASPGAAAPGKAPRTGPRTSGGGAGGSGASASGDSQTDLDAGSGTEDA